MSVESQYLGIKWSKTLEGLIELYNKKKPALDDLKARLKEIDGELEQEMAILVKSVDEKLDSLLLQTKSLTKTIREIGNYGLIELEENIACLSVLLEITKVSVDDREKLQKGICVKQGLKRISSALDQVLLFLSDPFKGLTTREQEILVYLSEGLSNEEIAKKLYISIKTVKNHVSSIYRKTGYRERAKLVLAARSFLG